MRAVQQGEGFKNKDCAQCLGLTDGGDDPKLQMQCLTLMDAATCTAEDVCLQFKNLKLRATCMYLLKTNVEDSSSKNGPSNNTNLNTPTCDDCRKFSREVDDDASSEMSDQNLGIFNMCILMAKQCTAEDCVTFAPRTQQRCLDRINTYRISRGKAPDVSCAGGPCPISDPSVCKSFDALGSKKAGWAAWQEKQPGGAAAAVNKLHKTCLQNTGPTTTTLCALWEEASYENKRLCLSKLKFEFPAPAAYKSHCEDCGLFEYPKQCDPQIVNKDSTTGKGNPFPACATEAIALRRMCLTRIGVRHQLCDIGTCRAFKDGVNNLICVKASLGVIGCSGNDDKCVTSERKSYFGGLSGIGPGSDWVGEAIGEARLPSVQLGNEIVYKGFRKCGMCSPGRLAGRHTLPKATSECLRGTPTDKASTEYSLEFNGYNLQCSSWIGYECSFDNLETRGVINKSPRNIVAHDRAKATLALLRSSCPLACETFLPGPGESKDTHELNVASWVDSYPGDLGFATGLGVFGFGGSVKEVISSEAMCTAKDCQMWDAGMMDELHLAAEPLVDANEYKKMRYPSGWVDTAREHYNLCMATANRQAKMGFKAIQDPFICSKLLEGEVDMSNGLFKPATKWQEDKFVTCLNTISGGFDLQFCHSLPRKFWSLCLAKFEATTEYCESSAQRNFQIRMGSSIGEKGNQYGVWGTAGPPTALIKPIGSSYPQWLNGREVQSNCEEPLQCSDCGIFMPYGARTTRAGDPDAMSQCLSIVKNSGGECSLRECAFMGGGDPDVTYQKLVNVTHQCLALSKGVQEDRDIGVTGASDSVNSCAMCAEFNTNAHQKDCISRSNLTCTEDSCKAMRSGVKTHCYKNIFGNQDCECKTLWSSPQDGTACMGQVGCQAKNTGCDGDLPWCATVLPCRTEQPQFGGMWAYCKAEAVNSDPKEPRWPS